MMQKRLRLQFGTPQGRDSAWRYLNAHRFWGDGEQKAYLSFRRGSNDPCSMDATLVGSTQVVKGGEAEFRENMPRFFPSITIENAE